MFLEKLTDAQIGCQPRLGAGYGHCFLPATSGWLPAYPLMKDIAGLFFPSFALLPLLCVCVCERSCECDSGILFSFKKGANIQLPLEIKLYCLGKHIYYDS